MMGCARSNSSGACDRLIRTRLSTAGSVLRALAAVLLAKFASNAAVPDPPRWSVNRPNQARRAGIELCSHGFRALRGGCAGGTQTRDILDSSIDTPSGSRLELSADSSSHIEEDGLAPSEADTSERESQQSTGLGIHQSNWTRIKEIGIPVFTMPEFDHAAREAKVLKRAAERGASAKGLSAAAKRSEMREQAERRKIAKEGRELGWFSSEDGREITGKPCETCKRVLCYCEHFRNAERLRKRGFVDPFARAKDSHILQPGSSPPPPPRTNRTRRVPHPVLIGHAASLTPY